MPVPIARPTAETAAPMGRMMRSSRCIAMSPAEMPVEAALARVKVRNGMRVYIRERIGTAHHFFSPPIAVCADEQGDDECGQRDCAPDNEHGIRARVRPGDGEPKERDRHRPYDEICGDEHELSESAAALDGVCALFEIVEIVKIV